MTKDRGRSFESQQLSSPNFLPPEEKPQQPQGERPKPQPQQKPKKRTRIFSCFFLVLLVILTSCTALIARSNNDFFVGVKNGFFIRQLTHIFTGSKDELQGEKEDRINFLLMGIGGPGHDGPLLTDTIILASFKPSTKQAAMLSIPRDLIIPDGNEYIKVNHIYALSQKDGFEKAFNRTKSLIGDAFGLKIHYMGVIDFQGFVEVIDTIGGVEVDVERSFTDYEFPAGPNQYQVVSFEEGKQDMDGITALRYARSRHGNNGEGSDFARSERQQKIIIATKEKLSSFSTIFNPQKITGLFNLVNEYTKTDIEPWEVVKLIQMTKDLNPATIGTTVLDDSPNGYLYSGISSINGAYILQPRSGNFDQLKLLAQGMIEGNPIAEELPKIVLENGTTVAGLAGSIATSMERFGIEPVEIANANRQNYVSTVIYDYTDGGKPLTADWLESIFKTKPQSNVPLELLPYTVAKTLELTDDDGSVMELDFLVILGEDTDDEVRNELIRTLTPAELAERYATSTPTSTDDGLETDSEESDETDTSGDEETE